MEHLQLAGVKGYEAIYSNAGIDNYLEPLHLIFISTDVQNMTCHNSPTIRTNGAD